MTYSIEENHHSGLELYFMPRFFVYNPCRRLQDGEDVSSLFLGGIIFISYKKEYPCKKAAYKLSDMCTSVDMRLTNLYSLKAYPKYSNDFIIYLKE